MKTKTLLFMLSVLIFSSRAFSQSDPRTQQYVAGSTQLVGAATSVSWAQSNTAPCAACEGMCWSCVWVGTGYLGATANAYSAGQSFYQASTLSTTGGGGALPPGAQNCINDPTQCVGGIPIDPNNPNSTTQPSPEDIQKLKNSANNILNLAQLGLEDLKTSGQWPSDIDMNDPDAMKKLAEKLPPMTPAEKAALQDYENKKAKMDAMSTQEKVDTVLSGEYGDYSSGGFRGVAGSDEFLDSFDPNSLLAMFQNQGMENSAPGYYGNVPLQVLNPHSKLSLFQRVSLKMKNFK